MTIETLAQQGREKIHTGLAGMDVAKLKQMRNAGLRSCFTHMDELKYRMEFVATIHGKQFINDAAGRNLNATWYALDSNEGENLTWITRGGVDQDYGMLAPVVKQKVRRIICIGDGKFIKNHLASAARHIEEVNDMREAVNSALYGSLEKTTVIFSPASDTSDMESEGRSFRHEVDEL